MDRRLKRYSTTGRVGFYDQQLLSYGSFSRTSSVVFWIKRKHKYNILNFFGQKISFHNLQKELKNTVPNTIAIDLS